MYALLPPGSILGSNSAEDGEDERNHFSVDPGHRKTIETIINDQENFTNKFYRKETDLVKQRTLAGESHRNEISQERVEDEAGLLPSRTITSGITDTNQIKVELLG